MRAPAVVGSWPEPFAQASAGGERLPVRIECRGAAAPCDAVAERLAECASVDASRARPTGASRALRLLVGPGRAVRLGPGRGPARRRPADERRLRPLRALRAGFRLLALDERAEVARAQASDAGLVAALRRGERPPTWVVTGTDAAGVAAAAEAARRRPARGPLRACVTPEGDRPAAGRAGVRMRSPLAYSPRPGPARRRERRSPRAPTSARSPSSPSSSRTRSCSPAPARRSWSPGSVAGAGRALAAAARWAATLGVLIVAVNGIASQRGETILVRGWELPVLGQIDVSAEALAEGGGAGAADRRRARRLRRPLGLRRSRPACCACCARSPATRR